MSTNLSTIKAALRIPSGVTIYDAELNVLVETAQAVMADAGVDVAHESQDVLDAACIMYVKANFGNRNDAERCGKAFDAIVKQRALVRAGDSNGS